MASSTPACRMSSAVSSSTRVSRLACFVFAIGDLLQGSFLDRLRDTPRVCRKPCAPDLAQRQQLIGIDVFPLAFGKAIEKHGPMSDLIDDQHAIATRSSLSG